MSQKRTVKRQVASTKGVSSGLRSAPPDVVVTRVQTGVRLERRLLKVLKALAELHDITLGDLLEGIVLHAFDGKVPFDEASRRRISDLKAIYGLDLDSRASHHMKEKRNG